MIVPSFRSLAGVFVLCTFVVLLTPENVASAQSELSAEDQSWLNQTCPRSLGPSLTKSCLERNTPAVSSQPSLGVFSSADQDWLKQTCPKSLGPSLRESCLERNIPAVQSPPELAALSQSDQAWLNQTCPKSLGPSLRKSCLDRNSAALEKDIEIETQDNSQGSFDIKSKSARRGHNGADGQASEENSSTRFEAGLDEERIRIAAREKQAEAKQRELIRSAQDGLSALGYYRDVVDGIAGPRTIGAIKQFQVDAGLPPSGKVSADLIVAIGVAIGMGAKAPVEPKREELWSGSSYGTGFVVSEKGHVLTNAHVIEGCQTITLSSTKNRLSVLSRDIKSDLALLQSPKLGKNFAKFRSKSTAELGEDVIVIGYPLQGILSSGATVTKGSVSALAGMGDDKHFFQISAPIQPGNSGGPVIDEAGNVVGVVVAKLNETEIYDLIGDLPQNVNFAISLSSVTSFLSKNSISLETGVTTKRSTAAIAAEGNLYTVPITCKRE
jgi:S1-C subfamily serine protease